MEEAEASWIGPTELVASNLVSIMLFCIVSSGDPFEIMAA